MKERAYQPRIQNLENRQMMAADIVFEHGVLKVTMDPAADTNVDVEAYYFRNQQYVRVVGNGVDFSPAKGNLIRADEVKQIQVLGTNRSDHIDLSDVEADDFPSLTGTRLNGYGRGDTIIGREVRDVIRGGRGNDVIDGQEGNDWLLGGAHHDKIFGGLGRDWIAGQGGNDDLWGNRSSSWDNERDYIFGGRGFDEADRDPKDRYRSVESLF